MSLEWFFTWWNAIYSVPLAFDLLFLTITSVLSLLGVAVGELFQLHADLEHDLGVDGDADLDADVGVDADGHPDGGDADGPHHPMLAGLLFLGAGHIPVVMLLQTFLLLWGVIGMGLHGALREWGPPALVVSLPLTGVLSALGTRLFARMCGRFFKMHESSAVRHEELIGRTGRVVYAVTPEAGTLHVRDRHGTLHRVRARTARGELAPASEAIVVNYDAVRRVYEVEDARLFAEPAA